MSLKEDISMKVNGRSQVPPGFRFHPTEEELLHYYLRKKIAYEKIDLDVIREVDLNKLEPWDIQEKCNIGSTPQNDWYFFSHKDKKYPTGTRTNRATAAGFWKATGRDKVVYSSLKRIGMRKTLVFYKGRAPHGLKSDWIMHEYRLDDIINIIPTQDPTVSNLCDCGHEEGWVVCRVFKKKNYHKSLESTQRSSLSAASMDTEASHLESLNNNNDVVLDQLLGYIDTSSRSCKQENSENFTHINHDMQQFVNPITNDNAFLHLPRLDSPGTMTTFVPPLSSPAFDQVEQSRNIMVNDDRDHDHQCIGNWVDLDRFVASQLNGQLMESSKHLFSCYGTNEYDERALSGYTTTVRPNEAACTSEVDIWSLAKIPSSVDPLCHLSV